MYWEKNVNFDTFDGHFMVNYIEPNLQEIIFGPIRVGLITQKQFWDHLKKLPFLGPDPLNICYLNSLSSGCSLSASSKSSSDD